MLIVRPIVRDYYCKNYSSAFEIYQMSASPVVKDKDQKVETQVKQPSTRNEKKNENTTVLYIRDTGDASKRPTVRDGIQKEVICREKKSQTAWEEKYGYLSGKVFQQILAEEAVAAGFPADTFKRKKLDTSTIKHFPIELAPSPPIPKTSVAVVGWRSARAECRLEFKGAMYISPKRTISPPLEPEAPPKMHQRFMLLG